MYLPGGLGAAVCWGVGWVASVYLRGLFGALGAENTGATGRSGARTASRERFVLFAGLDPGSGRGGKSGVVFWARCGRGERGV